MKEDSQRSKNVLRRSSKIIRLPGDNSRDADAPKPWSKAESLIKLIETDMNSIPKELKSIAKEVWNYDNVDDFIKVQQEVELPKLKRLADSVFYKHHQEAQRMIDFISDKKKLVDLYNQVRGVK